MPMTPRSARRWRAARTLAGLPATIAAVALLAGCSIGRLGPTPAPSGPIDHPSGATALVLRVFVGGGLVPPGFFVTEAPGFSLYGDGTLIYRDPNPVLPSPIPGITQGPPLQSAALSESQVQAVLADALDTGGLRTAKPQYDLPVADAPSTIFSFNAGGVHGQVTVNGLGLATPTNDADAAVLTKLAALRDRLLGFGSTISAAHPWLSDRYRAYLLDVAGTAAQATPIAWPWMSVSPSTWTNVSDGDASLAYPTRLMTGAEINALGLGPLGGGATGIVVRFGGAGGKLYGVSLRPLLPDETP